MTTETESPGDLMADEIWEFLSQKVDEYPGDRIIPFLLILSAAADCALTEVTEVREISRGMQEDLDLFRQSWLQIFLGNEANATLLKETLQEKHNAN